MPSIEYAFSRENQSFWQLNMEALLYDAGAAGANVARWRDYID
jgi:hypothetical protein